MYVCKSMRSQLLSLPVGRPVESVTIDKQVNCRKAKVSQLIGGVFSPPVVFVE